MSDGFSHAYWSYATALSLADRREEAVAICREADRLNPDEPTTKAILGWALARAGHLDAATGILEQFIQEHRDGHFVALMVAHVYVGFGNHDETFRWLSRAWDERDGFLCYLKAWAVWIPLRSDPRFQALLRRMNFPCAG